MRHVGLGLLALAFAACDVTVTTNSCNDAILNGNETDVDCGGSCAACPDGRLCLRNNDCASGTCASDGRCGALGNSCTDGVQNGTETDVDCGGGTCGACADGRVCAASSDCASGICASDGRCGIPGSLPSESGAQVYSIDNGAGLLIAAGSQAGYGITANAGGSYRIVWTGDAGSSGTFREFTGTVWTHGTFDSFSTGCGGTCNLEPEDLVNQPQTVSGGQRIDFDAFATTGLDGFDFTATQEPVYFELFVDGQHRPDLVFFSSGGQASNAGSDPFALQTQ